MLLRTIVEKEKSKGTVKTKSQQEKVNDVHIDGGCGRGVVHHFTLVLVGVGRLITLSYSPLPGHHPSINNLSLGPGLLFILLYGELLLESRDSSCIEKNQLSFSNYTALHTDRSVEKQIPLPAKQGLKLLVRLTYRC